MVAILLSRPPSYGCALLKSLSHISYNDKTWCSYTLPKEDPKYVNHVSCDTPRLKGCLFRHDCNFDDVRKIGYSRPS